MKKGIALFIFSLGISFLACQKAMETCAVSGHIDDIETGYVSFINISNPENRGEVLDSASIIGHKFNLDLGSLKGIIPVSIVLKNTENGSTTSGLFLASNGDSKCNLENGRFVFTGNAVQDTFTKVTSTFMALAMKFQMYALSNPDSFKIVTNELHQLTIDLLERHGESEFNQFAYSVATNYLSLKFGESYYNKFLKYCTEETDINENVWKYNFCRQLEMRTNINAGINLDPSFSLLDENGDTVTLDDYSNKVVLLDFWAYWCRPCLDDIPKLKLLYEKYAPLGFQIISVSTDLKEKPWIKSILKNNTPWIQLMDDKDQENSLAQKLEVGPIPRYILLDRNHKIVYFEIDSKDLDLKISELLNH